MASKVEITRNGRVVSEAEAIDVVFDLTHERVAVRHEGGKVWIAQTNELTPELNDCGGPANGYSVRFLGRV